MGVVGSADLVLVELNGCSLTMVSSAFFCGCSSLFSAWVRWLQDGDANTTLFRLVANGRRAKDFIPARLLARHSLPKFCFEVGSPRGIAMEVLTALAIKVEDLSVVSSPLQKALDICG